MKYVICDFTGEAIGAATRSEAEAAAYVKETNAGMIPGDKYHYVSSSERLSWGETYNFGLLQLGRSAGV